MTRRFRVKIDAVLHAEDLDDAFSKIGDYYTELAQSGEADSPWDATSECSIQPED